MFSSCSSIYPFVVAVARDDILKVNEHISMQIGLSGLWSKGMKRSTFGVRRSKSSRSHSAEIGRSLSARCLKNFPTNFNQTWQAHITINAHCVAASVMQKIKD